jgi:hypothetical protein
MQVKGWEKENALFPSSRRVPEQAPPTTARGLPCGKAFDKFAILILGIWSSFQGFREAVRYDWLARKTAGRRGAGA